MTPSPTSLEIYDSPLFVRALLTCLGGVTGILLSVVVYKSCEALGAWRTTDIVAFAVGLAFLMFSAAWWLFPVSRRQELLKANSDGLYIREVGLPRKHSAFVFVPWKDVGEFSLGGDETWCVQFTVRLSEHDRIRLRNRVGGYPRDSSGFVAFAVPVLTKRRGVKAVEELQALRKSHV